MLPSLISKANHYGNLKIQDKTVKFLSVLLMTLKNTYTLHKLHLLCHLKICCDLQRKQFSSLF